jgi:hypothetical protein
MIAANHPSFHGMVGAAPGVVSERIPVVIRSFASPYTPPQNQISPVSPAAPVSPAPPTSVPASASAASAPASSTASSTISSAAAPAAAPLPVQVSNLVDPATGVTYAGYLTQDAQTLYQSGALLTGGNQLTPQGSALAAQGDLIVGTPAPAPQQIAQPIVAAAPATDFFSSIEAWLSSETLFAGYPNGLVAAGGVIAAAWLFGGKKGRRR